jgi:hypothetical protein
MSNQYRSGLFLIYNLSEMRQFQCSRFQKHSGGQCFPASTAKEAFCCRICRQRLFAAQSSASGSKQVVESSRSQLSTGLLSTQTWSRLACRQMAIAIFAAAFFLVWIFLRNLTAEKCPSQNSGCNKDRPHRCPFVAWVFMGIDFCLRGLRDRCYVG